MHKTTFLFQNTNIIANTLQCRFLLFCSLFFIWFLTFYLYLFSIPFTAFRVSYVTAFVYPKYGKWKILQLQRNQPRLRSMLSFWNWTMVVSCRPILERQHVLETRLKKNVKSVKVLKYKPMYLSLSVVDAMFNLYYFFQFLSKELQKSSLCSFDYLPKRQTSSEMFLYYLSWSFHFCNFNKIFTILFAKTCL